MFGAVFWPEINETTFPLIEAASDHRLVYMDFVVLPILKEAVRDLRAEREAGDVVLTWRAQPGITYKPERSDNLATWSDTPSIQVQIEGENARAVDAGALSANSKFYRISCSLEP